MYRGSFFPEVYVVVDYWVTRRGIRRGEVPNPCANLYGIYVSFVRKLDLQEVAPESFTTFKELFESRGFQKIYIKRRACYLLSKYIVPKSVLDPTARRKPKKKRKPYTPRKKCQ